jgi:hypothetical protein
MNIPYIAHAYHVPPDVVHQALGLPPGHPDRRPLWQIAREQGRSPNELIKNVTTAINQARPPRPPTPGPAPTPPGEQRGSR